MKNILSPSNKSEKYSKWYFLVIFWALVLYISRLIAIFAPYLIRGGLAHLARARHWQCRGDRFESDTLHTQLIKIVNISSLKWGNP